MGKRCKEQWSDAILSDKFIKTKEDVLSLLDEHHPDAVLNAAGVVGKPNVDWCETNQVETILGNTVLPIIIALACQERQVYLLHIGTGCVYYDQAPHAGGWQENDPANPSAVYTKTKYAADLCLSVLPNVGIGRIRMPIDSIPFKGNLIDKLASFKKVIDVENSVTVVEDMIKVFYALLGKKAVGIFHVVNPGTVKHKQILQWYKEIVDSSHNNEWITAQDLVAQGLAHKKRSNVILQSPNLERLGITMRPVEEAIKDALKKYAQIKNNQK